MDTAARSFPAAARWYAEAIARDPAPELYNAAGYVLAYAGDLQGATGRLQRYRELRPAEANPLDSLGEVYYYFGRLQEAERYLGESHAKSPAFLGAGGLYKAAWARLMMGDRKGADAYAQRFWEARAGTDDPRTARLHAQWDFLAGRRAEAVARIERDPSPAAAAHRAVWALIAGDRATAASYAPLRPVFDACLAVLDGRPAEAIPIFRKLYEMTPPGSPEPTGVLLAWALIEAGKPADARPLLEPNPIPDAVIDHPLVALAWPRILELRKAIRPR
jgi:tetratricopeptide (TPR) repeat protein